MDVILFEPCKESKGNASNLPCISIYLQQTSYFALSNLIYLGIRNHVSSTHSLQEVPFRSSVRFGVKTLSSPIPLWLSQWQAWTGSEMLGDSVILKGFGMCYCIYICIYRCGTYNPWFQGTMIISKGFRCGGINGMIRWEMFTNASRVG